MNCIRLFKYRFFIVLLLFFFCLLNVQCTYMPVVFGHLLLYNIVASRAFEIVKPTVYKWEMRSKHPGKLSYCLHQTYIFTIVSTPLLAVVTRFNVLLLLRSGIIWNNKVDQNVLIQFSTNLTEFTRSIKFSIKKKKKLF